MKNKKIQEIPKVSSKFSLFFLNLKIKLRERFKKLINSDDFRELIKICIYVITWGIPLYASLSVLRGLVPWYLQFIALGLMVWFIEKKLIPQIRRLYTK